MFMLNMRTIPDAVLSRVLAPPGGHSYFTNQRFLIFWTHIPRSNHIKKNNKIRKYINGSELTNTTDSSSTINIYFTLQCIIVQGFQCTKQTLNILTILTTMDRKKSLSK